MVEIAELIFHGARFNESTFPRALADFAVDPLGRAYVPQDDAMKHMPDHNLIGREYGEVVVLSDGLQAVPHQPGELSRIRLFGSGSSDKKGSLHHYAFWHGQQQELKTKALIGFVQQCPGMLFELNCGCGDHRNHIVEGIFGADADAGVIVSFDSETAREQRVGIAKGILESVGVSDVRHVVNHYPWNPLEDDCSLRQTIAKDSLEPKIYFGPNKKPFMLTHDLPVAFADNGEPARLMVFKEPAPLERKGFNDSLKTYYILIVGDIRKKVPVVRYHSECVTADHGSNACDCNEQRLKSLQYMRENVGGILIHAPEDGMALGKVAKLPQTVLTLSNQANLLSAREEFLGIPGDLRNYDFIDVVRQVLGLDEAKIASNNKSKISCFEKNGIHIVGSYPMKPDVDRLAPQAQRDILAKIESGRYNQY